MNQFWQSKCYPLYLCPNKFQVCFRKYLGSVSFFVQPHFIILFFSGLSFNQYSWSAKGLGYQGWARSTKSCEEKDKWTKVINGVLVSEITDTNAQPFAWCLLLRNSVAFGNHVQGSGACCPGHSTFWRPAAGQRLLSPGRGVKLAIYSHFSCSQRERLSHGPRRPHTQNRAAVQHSEILPHTL